MPVETTIAVANLAPALSEDHLKELFGCCGTIKSGRFESAPNGDRVYLIEFDTEAGAKAATFLSGTPLAGKKLLVAPALSSSPSAAGSTVQPSVFGGADSALLANPMLAAQVAMQQATLAAQGLSSTGAMESAAIAAGFAGMANMPSHILAAGQKRADEVARTIYVGNLGAAVDETTLRQLFSSVGEILFCKVAGDVVSGIRYGFVEFKDLAAAAAAQALSGTMVGDRAIKVGKANNPIVKTPSTTANAAPQPAKLELAMRVVQEQKERIARKIAEEEARKKARETRDAERELEKKAEAERPPRKSRSRSKGSRSSANPSRRLCVLTCVMGAFFFVVYREKQIERAR